MKLFSNNIVPYTSTEGDKIYPIVVDIKKGIKSGEAISFVTADNQVGVITVDFMDGNSSYSIEGCMVTSTIRRPDGTVLEVPCDIIAQSTIEIPLGINGTYQEGVHTFDLKIIRGNGKIIGVPTMSYSVSGSLSSDDVVEGDDRLPVLTMVLDNAQDKLTRLDKAIAGATNDLEVKEARDGEVTLNARLERDLAKGKIHFVDIEGSIISTESQEGYLENIEIYGNTWQNAENLADIRSVGTKVEGQELYEIPVLSTNKNLWDSNNVRNGNYYEGRFVTDTNNYATIKPIQIEPNTKYTSSNKTNTHIMRVTFYDKDMNYISLASSKTVTSPSNAKYVNLHVNVASEDIQFEKGASQTSYIKHDEDKLTILSPTPLEKVGDVADRIICKDGVWGVEKNIETKYLRDMVLLDNAETDTYYRLGNYSNTFPMRDDIILCDSYKVGTSASTETTQTQIMAYKHSLTKTEIRLAIQKNDVPNITNISELVEKVKNENNYIKYQLAEPQFMPLPHDQQIKLRTFADRTNISFLTEIEPTLKAQVPKSLGATVNTHTTQIDNLNKELDRVKKLEESTVSTVTTDKAFTTIAETTQGYFEDVKLEGKTLVNLNAGLSEFNYNCSSSYTDYSIIHKGSDYLEVAFNSIPSVWNYISTPYLRHTLLKPSTEYTIIFEKLQGIKQIKLCNGSSSEIFSPPQNVSGNVIKVTTLGVFPDVANHIMVYCTPTYKENAVVGRYVILEGDHTDKDITFFEGLKSVGQDTDAVEILSKNKNLFKGELILTDIVDGQDNNSIAHASSEDFIEVKPNTLYTLSSPNSLYNTLEGLVIAYYDVGKNFIKHVNMTKNEISPSNAKYCRIRTRKKPQSTITPEELLFIQLQLEEGSSVSSYVPHSSNKKQILYHNPTTQTWEKPVLREWDSIEKHSDGKYYYHKRSKEIVFDGSEEWRFSTNHSSDTHKWFFVANTDLAQYTSVICDRFKYKNEKHEREEEFIYTDADINVMIDVTKLSSSDYLRSFKQWLQANPVTVVYQLAKEEVYECTNLDLITYPNETNLIVNSGAIQPRITLKVLSNVSNVVKLLQEKVSILENKFIKGLQQVLAGDMMSLAHLLYPEDFEHETQTLEL